MEVLRTDLGVIEAKFELGRLLATPGVLSAIASEDMITALKRHASGNWGNLDREDWRANEQALADRGRLLSAYLSASGIKFWIITEADRSATTALLPEEY